MTIDSGKTLGGVSSRIQQFRERVVSVFKVESTNDTFSPKTHAEHENNGYAFVRAHIYHGMIDIAVSLLGIAVVINSLFVSLLSTLPHSH